MTTINENEEFIKVTPIRTWAEIWHSYHDSRWMLWMLDWADHTDSELRLFACWCARQAWRVVKCKFYVDLVETAERFASGAAERREMATLWRSCGDGAADAEIFGMPDCIPGAAAQLASVETCRDEASEAAWSAAWYASKAAGFKAAAEEVDKIGWGTYCNEKWRASNSIRTFIDKNPQTSKEAENIARAEQADALKQIMCNPISREVREVSIPAQTLAYWMTWGFVPEKDIQKEWQFCSDLLGVEVSFNTLVKEYSPSGVVVCISDAVGKL